MLYNLSIIYESILNVKKMVTSLKILDLGIAFFYDLMKIRLNPIKTTKRLLFVLFTTCSLGGQSQVYDMEKVYVNNYDSIMSKSDYLFVNKNGRILDSNKNGVIYKESFYSEGIPVGTWKLNYPNGKLRKVIEYDNNGNVVKWKRCYNEKTIIEIIPDSIIDIATILNIADFEESIFDKESVVIVPANEVQKRSAKAWEMSYFSTIIEHVSLDFSKVLSVLDKTTFSGQCYIYNYNKALSKEAVYRNGKQSVLKDYYYRGSKLKFEYLFYYGRLQSLTKYDSKGNVKKVSNEFKVENKLSAVTVYN